MALMSLQFRGLRQMERRIVQLAVQHPRVAQRALVSEGEIELTEMKKRTPVDFGTLRDSGRLEPIPPLGIKWVFGGAAKDYAIAVHENVGAFHETGQDHYVESVVLEFIPHAADRVGRRWAAELGLR
jgi:hypothetical protein